VETKTEKTAVAKTKRGRKKEKIIEVKKVVEE